MEGERGGGKEKEELKFQGKDVFVFLFVYFLVYLFVCIMCGWCYFM